jgi:hypothetical protein
MMNSFKISTTFTIGLCLKPLAFNETCSTGAHWHEIHRRGFWTLLQSRWSGWVGSKAGAAGGSGQQWLQMWALAGGGREGLKESVRWWERVAEGFSLGNGKVDLFFIWGGCKAGIAVALMGQHKPFIPF